MSPKHPDQSTHIIVRSTLFFILNAPQFVLYFKKKKRHQRKKKLVEMCQLAFKTIIYITD